MRRNDEHTYLVQHLLCRQVDRLLEHVAVLVQLDRLGPVIKGARYVHLSSVIRPASKAASATSTVRPETGIRIACDSMSGPRTRL